MKIYFKSNINLETLQLEQIAQFNHESMSCENNI